MKSTSWKSKIIK